MQGLYLCQIMGYLGDSTPETPLNTSLETTFGIFLATEGHSEGIIQLCSILSTGLTFQISAVSVGGAEVQELTSHTHATHVQLASFPDSIPAPAKKAGKRSLGTRLAFIARPQQNVLLT